MIRPALGTYLILLPALVPAQSLPVSHDPTVECIPANRSVLVRMKVPVGTRLSRARTYFRRARMPETWFHIEMGPARSAPDRNLFEGGLPKPKKELVGETIQYYISAESVDANTGQTQEYQGVVVRDIEECKKRPPLSPRVSPGTIPSGFVGGASAPGDPAPRRATPRR